MTTINATFSCLLCGLLIFTEVGYSADPAPLKLPPGFEATIYAADNVVGSVQCMTTNSRGEIVISAPGSIKTLIDENGDGVVDSVRVFANGPNTGAQGMCFDGADLYCIGDGGILKYTDQDRDGVADGEAEVIFRCRTGGEHNAHALRKGPDGYWYFLVGNDANLDLAFLNADRSPLQKPDAGMLLRFSPDFQQIEVLCDGFRNAYDFDFNSTGEIFVYDSDGERDISLPWYRPTRLFHSVPGMTHGWKSRSWKVPNYDPSMSPTLLEAGRGSPTGVVCYRHHAFPKEFHNAVFILDWTYGRIIAAQNTRRGASFDCEHRDFATGVGNFGFAPTDAVVGPEGALYVSVGGRGTQGAVFRIMSKKPNSAAATDEVTDEISNILRQPQPLSSWARKTWEAACERIGEEDILRAALDQTRPIAHRIRAVEILTEIFEGPDVDFMKRMQREEDRELRARAVWAYGRSTEGNPDALTLQPFLVDSSPVVVRNALEALETCPAASLQGFENEVAGCLSHSDRVVRLLAVRVAGRMTDPSFRQVGDSARKAGWPAALRMARAFVDRGYVGHSYAWHDIGVAALSKVENPELKLEAVQLIQHALGGFGDSPVHAAVFDGYLPRLPLEQEVELLQNLRTTLEENYPSGQPVLDWEMARLIAMTSPESLVLLDKISKQLTETSSCISDIHHLIVLSTNPTPRTPDQRNLIATTLLNLHTKLKKESAVIDRNWEPRVREMFDALVKKDPSLTRTLVEHEQFGKPEHQMFLSSLPEKLRQQATEKYLVSVQEGSISLTPELLRTLGSLSDEAVLEMARKRVSDPLFTTAALEIILANNQETDRDIIRTALLSDDLIIAGSALKAIREWSDFSPFELAAIAQLMKQLSRVDQHETLWDNAMTAMQQFADQLLVEDAASERTLPEFEEGAGSRQELAELWGEWLATNFPEASDKFEKSISSPKRLDWEAKFKQVNWDNGNVEAGEQLFVKKQCATCHNSHTAVGPRLTAVTSRFNRHDLFEAIFEPHRDVSSRYRMEMITTAEGKTFSGVIIYESVDGLLLRDTGNRTVRIEAADVEFRKQLTTSLMPDNLLDDCSVEQLADLDAYLRSLSK